MPLDPHAKRLLDMLAVSATPRTDARAAGERADPKVRRAAFEQLLRLGATREPVAGIEDFTIPGQGGPIALRQYVPLHAATQTGALLYFHGGGLVAGSLDSHDGLCRILANAAGCPVFAVDYRLAPEHPFPAAIDDGLTALSWLLAHAAQHGIDPRCIGVAGDSAGANLAAVICQTHRDIAGPPLALQLLLCPILDVSAETASRRDFATGFLVDLEDYAQELDDYLPPGLNRADPRVSPLRADSLAGLPLTHIHTAQFDPMRDEGLAYAQRLQQAGVEVQYTCHDGMIHMFYALTGLIPSAAPALRRIAAQMKAALASVAIPSRGAASRPGPG